MSFADRCFELLRARQIDPATMPPEFGELRARLALQGCELFAVPDRPEPVAYVMHWRRGPMRTRRCYAAVHSLAAVREHAQRLESGRR